MGLIKSRLFATLGAQGAVFVEREGRLSADRFGEVAKECAAGRNGTGLYDRSHRPTVSFKGKDARRFLNGMFSNNIRALPIGMSRRNVMLDDKGRVQGELEIWCLADDSFLVTLEGLAAEAFMERYDRFIIMDEVEMADLTEEYVQLSLQGPESLDILAKAAMPAPQQEGAFVEVEGLYICRRARSKAGGIDLLVPQAQVMLLWEALRGAGAVPVGEEAQEVLRIEAGLARWPVDMGERSLVHELRMVEHYCAFDKGCYIGQEVINRIDVMGQVNKKLYGLQLGIDGIPPSGAEVLLGDTVVGTVCSGAREGSRVRVLAILRKAAWKDGLEVQIRAGERVAPATVSELPFP